MEGYLCSGEAPASCQPANLVEVALDLLTPVLDYLAQILARISMACFYIIFHCLQMAMWHPATSLEQLVRVLELDLARENPLASR